ncbi:MAG TPA: hypothetical protein VGY53_10715 [Isosphaeraceae bacterium]|jgi:hypothetical protein|nr:hypothetical protein [Isosphaeraceae bacterium]
MTIHLSKDLENSIRAAVKSGRFSSVDDAVAAAWLAFSQSLNQVPACPQEPAASQEPSAQGFKPIWEVAEEIRKQIPAEEWAKLPADGAKQLDHYIYGSPKRPPA